MATCHVCRKKQATVENCQFLLTPRQNPGFFRSAIDAPTPNFGNHKAKKGQRKKAGRNRAVNTMFYCYFESAHPALSD